MNLKVAPVYKPAKVIKIPSISSVITVRPKNAVAVPTINSRPAQILHRPPQRPTQRPQVKLPVVRNQQQPKPKPTGISKPVSMVLPKVKERSLTPIRPSQLRKSQDAILGKHLDKIRDLRGCGHGKILVILACGPSINQAPIEKLKGHTKIDIMCINKPEMRVWPSTYWIFCDQSQYNRNQEYWSSYRGTIINAASVRASHPNQIMIRTISGKGFSRDITKGFHIGRSTTYASMQVALWMGYNRIYIFGCDMSAVDGKMHRYGQNPDVSNENRAKRFEKEAEHYDWAVNNLKEDEMRKFVLCSSYNKFAFTKRFENLVQTNAVDVILDNANELLTSKEAIGAKI